MKVITKAIRIERLKNRLDMIALTLTDKEQTYEDKLSNISTISGGVQMENDKLLQELMGFNKVYECHTFLSLNERGTPELSGWVRLVKDDIQIEGQFIFKNDRWKRK